MCQNSAEHLRGPLVVVVQHPAEPFTSLDVSAHIRLAAPIVDQPIVDSLMVALDVVVLRVLLHGVAQMPLSQRDDLGQTLGFDGTDESLRVGVQIWTSRRKLHRRHARGPEGLSK